MPSGTSHAISPVAASTATRRAQGGLKQGSAPSRSPSASKIGASNGGPASRTKATWSSTPGPYSSFSVIQPLMG